jgi:Ca2+-binding EF-hand superfamily protein
MSGGLYSSRNHGTADEHKVGSCYQRWIATNHEKSKVAIKDNLHHWRTADFDEHFKTCDKGSKGYLNSKEQRKMLTDAGITMMKTFEIVKQDKYMTLDQITGIIETMLPQATVTHRVQALFEYYDRKDSADGRLTGFVHEETVMESLLEHGVEEQDAFIFISPFQRNDKKIEYGRVIEQLFPEDLKSPRRLPEA